MREILFRGKLLAGTSAGEWVYGNLVIKPGQIAIITLDDTPIGRYGRVDPSTVGQYTGLTDKNGVRIFEGDICRCEGCFTGAYNALVEFFGSAWTLTNPHMPADTMFPSELMEVIGNIHDNPEMMEGGSSS